ncbi:MAG: protein kinase [Deltaproteobacteria bacterium]|nr:protein kinase [Deltaproteobacteria bacterium]
MQTVRISDHYSHGSVIAGKRLGRYEVLARIASGGMAVIYIARSVGVAGFERLFAIKVLHAHLAHEHDFVAMFLDEARLAAKIRHTNVLSAIDVSDLHDSEYYLVMDYIEGDHLGALLKNTSQIDQRIPARDALRVVVDALNGLAAAHELTDEAGRRLNLVHRDISPQNILVGTDGVSRLTDFGVAKVENRICTTRNGALKGKLAYMAPEQAFNGHVDQRSDLFAMGIVLWECLTGRRLFRADNQGAVLNMICNEPIAAPSSVDPELAPLDSVLAKALERKPDLRFQSALELIDAIETAAARLGGIASRRSVESVIKKYACEKLNRERELVREAIAALGIERASDPQIESQPHRVSFFRLKADRPDKTVRTRVLKAKPNQIKTLANREAATLSFARSSNVRKIVTRKAFKLKWLLGGIAGGISIAVALVSTAYYTSNSELITAHSLRGSEIERAAPDLLREDFSAISAADSSDKRAVFAPYEKDDSVRESATNSRFSSANYRFYNRVNNSEKNTMPGENEKASRMAAASALRLLKFVNSLNRITEQEPSPTMPSLVDLPDNPFEHSSEPEVDPTPRNRAISRDPIIADIPDNPFRPRSEPEPPGVKKLDSPPRADAIKPIPKNPFD